jgi:hypothetical protein
MKNTNIATVVAAMLAGGAIVWGATAAAGNDDATGRLAASQAPRALQQHATRQQGSAPPGFGTRATGDAADKAAAAATAEYDGDVEGVMQLQDGSYVVHVITSSGEVHVAVSEHFEVTGVDEGGPGGGGAA